MVFVYLPSFGQYRNTAYEIKWSDQWAAIPSLESGEDDKRVPTFVNAVFTLQTNVFPLWTAVIPVHTAGNYRVAVENAVWEDAEDREARLWEAFAEKLPAPITEIRINRKKPELYYSFCPIRKSPLGRWQKLIRFSLSPILVAAAPVLTRGQDYTDESILSSGNFYKIKTSADGIYKIDHTLLTTLGVSGSVSIQNLRLYANGAGMLPDLAGAARADDLQPIPVELHDIDADGLFGEDDYALFYGQSPHRWLWDSIRSYSYEKNIYENYVYYFLSFDQGPATTLPTDTDTGIPNYFSDATDFLWIEETESQNFLSGGREWYSDVFNVGTEKSFSLTVPGLIAGSQAKANMAAVSRSFTANSSFSLRYEGQSIINLSLDNITAGYEKPYAKAKSGSTNFFPATSDITLTARYSNTAGEGQGWLDFISLSAKQTIQNATQLIIRDENSVAPGRVTEYHITNFSEGTKVWDVTNPYDVRKKDINNDRFRAASDDLKTYVLFDGSFFYAPEPVGPVAPQNLHAVLFPDMIIITPDAFVSEATRLADIHRAEGLEVIITPLPQIYNEFSGGRQDVAAIRNYVKMFYDRAGTDDSRLPRYLLLLGDGSYDYKNLKYAPDENTNLVPTFQSNNSLDPIYSYTSDDYFALLDDNEGDNLDASYNSLDLGVGRMPVASSEEAATMVDKVLHYHSAESRGEWTNSITFIGDDEDNNRHLEHAESHAFYIKENFPLYNVDKIYLDAYEQVSGATGATYPEVVTAINNKIFNGSLVLNYVGHGGERGLAHEGILNVNQIKAWQNLNKLPLFITATCSFSRYDDPSKRSAGEYLMMNPQGGSIANMTTVRLVFADYNKTMNEDFLENLFIPGQTHLPALGDAARMAKNAAGSSATGDNNRKFTLLGDPALHLHYSELGVATLSIKDENDNITDTLKAQSLIKITGEVRNAQGSRATDFSGEIIPVIYDKPLLFHTRGQDSNSLVTDFEIQKSVVFKGRSSVENGYFEFNCKVPKDIAVNIGPGKVSYYAYSTTNSAGGADTTIAVGGISAIGTDDNSGPEIKLFLNDEKFVFGGITNEDPVLIAKLTDESGINTVGTGIGHDLTAVIDEDAQHLLVLNDYYKAALNLYTQGEIRYPISDLKPGRHQIEVKAWDALNNSGTGYTEFIVEDDAVLALGHVLNYPNPFTDHTQFWVEHNKPGQELKVRVQVFSISGKLIRTLERYSYSPGNRISDIEWDGTDEFGQKIGRGVYVYRVSLSSQDLETASKLEKIVILK